MWYRKIKEHRVFLLILGSAAILRLFPLFNYQFTFEMQFSMTNRSPFNIAPVDGKSVTIDKKKLNLSCFV